MFDALIATTMFKEVVWLTARYRSVFQNKAYGAWSVIMFHGDGDPLEVPGVCWRLKPLGPADLQLAQSRYDYPVALPTLGSAHRPRLRKT
jgi:hypothetical protein